MGQAKGTTAYPSARSLLDRALESENGIKVQLGSWKKAFRMRQNCYTVRSRERTASTRFYDISHPLYGNTPWDGLELNINEAGELIITKGLALEVEEL